MRLRSVRKATGRKGFMLAEIVVATALLATMVGAYMTFYTAVKRNFRTSDYDYVAINLCRDALSFAAAGTFMPSTSMTCSASGGLGSLGGLLSSLFGGSSSSSSSAYTSASCGLIFPGINLKTAGLVPKGAPNSVVVSVNTVRMASMNNAPNITVTVQWKDTDDGITRTRTLSTIPLFYVNDQLRLTISNFSWT
ncbi:MAG: hypothetical protein WC421_06260 [Elusimicrobiales bacterium]